MYTKINIKSSVLRNFRKFCKIRKWLWDFSQAHKKSQIFQLCEKLNISVQLCREKRKFMALC